MVCDRERDAREGACQHRNSGAYSISEAEGVLDQRIGRRSEAETGASILDFGFWISDDQGRL